MDKQKGLIIELASIETEWDCVKWVIFSLFAIIYFGIRENYPWSAVIFAMLFVGILFMVNIIKELQKYNEKRKNL